MMNNSGEPAVRARGLRVVRGGRTVLDSLDFDLHHGQVTGLLGPSGCGKSTLMRAIAGTQAKVSGTLDVLGSPAGTAPLRSRVGYVTQAPSIYDDLSARQNLDYYASVLDPSLSRAARADQVARALAEVDLEDHAEQLTGNLSGGQRSRVSLAIALLGSPELLVLDEPTVGLDPVLRRDLWHLFHRLADERGTTLLVSSHVMDEAERCRRLLLMRAGRVLADDTPEELRRRTGSATVEDAFLRLVDAEKEAEKESERAERNAPRGPRNEKGTGEGNPGAAGAGPAARGDEPGNDPAPHRTPDAGGTAQ
ncbi:ABC transporter ATP-binding protein [Streptomyces xinghaiensis]|uniref:ABC transporter ATP-binding protein n=1 Tax=Streptomyces xinghaiensis TaxID=1038928 RepID=UPI003425FABA